MRVLPATPADGRTTHGVKRLDRARSPRRHLVTYSGAGLSWVSRWPEPERTAEWVPGFSVYREGRPIATDTRSTNYLEPADTPAFQRAVALIVRGKEGRITPPGAME